MNNRYLRHSHNVNQNPQQFGGKGRSRVNWPFIDVVKMVIPPLGHVIEKGAKLGHERPEDKGKSDQITLPTQLPNTANPFNLALGMVDGALDMSHLAKRAFGHGVNKGGFLKPIQRDRNRPFSSQLGCALFPSNPACRFGKGTGGDFIQVFEHADFKGRSKNLPIGRYGMLPSGISNDSISSVKIPKGLKATFYEHGGFKGRPRTYSSDVANFGDFNDSTSSIVVEKSNWADRLIPDKRIDFEKIIPPETTQKIRSKVDEKMREETPAVVRWTGIHKSEMAKDKARERIRDMLPNRLEDKGIEDYLVGRKPVGLGLAGGAKKGQYSQMLGFGLEDILSNL